MPTFSLPVAVSVFRTGFRFDSARNAADYPTASHKRESRRRATVVATARGTATRTGGEAMTTHTNGYFTEGTQLRDGYERHIGESVAEYIRRVREQARRRIALTTEKGE